MSWYICLCFASDRVLTVKYTERIERMAQEYADMFPTVNFFFSEEALTPPRAHPNPFYI